MVNWSSAGSRAGPARGRQTMAHTVAPSGVGTRMSVAISVPTLVVLADEGRREPADLAIGLRDLLGAEPRDGIGHRHRVVESGPCPTESGAAGKGCGAMLSARATSAAVRSSSRANRSRKARWNASAEGIPLLACSCLART